MTDMMFLRVLMSYMALQEGYPDLSHKSMGLSSSSQNTMQSYKVYSISISMLLDKPISIYIYIIIIIVIIITIIMIIIK